MDKMIESLVKQGPYGLALAVTVYLAVTQYQTRIADFQSRLEEARSDKAGMARIIEANTVANTRLAGNVEQNTKVMETLIISISNRK